MSETYYHVAPTTYQAGDDLLCWNMLEARGIGIVTEADWKWAEAPVGADGHVVCLGTADQMDDLEWIMDEFGGQLLKVTIPSDKLVDYSDSIDWDDEDEDRVSLTSVAEGSTTYAAAVARIPGEYVEVVA